MGNKDCFIDLEIIAQGSADQGFEGIYYFHAMACTRKHLEHNKCRINHWKLWKQWRWITKIIVTCTSQRNIETGESNIKQHRHQIHQVTYQVAVFRRCSVKKVFLNISQNSQESTCARVSFLIKLQIPCLKKKL